MRYKNATQSQIYIEWKKKEKIPKKMQLCAEIGCSDILVRKTWKKELFVKEKQHIVESVFEVKILLVQVSWSLRHRSRRSSYHGGHKITFHFD